MRKGEKMNLLDKLDELFDMLYDMKDGSATFTGTDLLCKVYDLERFISAFRDSMYFETLQEYYACVKGFAWCENYGALDYALEDLYNAVATII